jgi:hypothetical protein
MFARVPPVLISAVRAHVALERRTTYQSRRRLLRAPPEPRQVDILASPTAFRFSQAYRSSPDRNTSSTIPPTPKETLSTRCNPKPPDREGFVFRDDSIHWNENGDKNRRFAQYLPDHFRRGFSAAHSMPLLPIGVENVSYCFPQRTRQTNLGSDDQRLVSRCGRNFQPFAEKLDAAIECIVGRRRLECRQGEGKIEAVLRSGINPDLMRTSRFRE